jgi:hypothetical protein
MGYLPDQWTLTQDDVVARSSHRCGYGDGLSCRSGNSVAICKQPKAHCQRLGASAGAEYRFWRRCRLYSPRGPGGRLAVSILFA